MSGAATGRPQFAIRLGAEGAAQVEATLRQVQDAAARTGSAMQQAGESTGTALAVIDRGAQAASAGLTRVGGDAAALVPIMENAGGAVGRVVAALGSGAGLLGVMGAVGGVIAAAITTYQNWGTVTRGVGEAYDFVTGRVRIAGEQIAATNTLLREFQRLAETGPERDARGQVATEVERARQAQGQVTQYDQQIATLREQIARGRDAAEAAAEQQRLGRAAGLPQVMDTGDPVARQRALETELRVAEANRATANRVLRGSQGNIAALGEATGTVINPRLDPNNDPNLPVPPEWQDPAARSGGGGVARQVNDALREREALVRRNMTADERYAQGMGRIADLQDRLRAQDPNSVLPDEVVQREAVRLMDEYEQATQRADDAQQRVADGAMDISRLSNGISKTLAGGFEEFVFEGRRANDVLKEMERQLLRLGNQHFLEPLFGGLVDGALGLLGLGGAAGGKGGSASGGGAGGAVAGLVSRLLGGGGGSEIAGAGLLKSATSTTLFHEGGLVGLAGRPGPMVPLSLFADAPRFHAGGLIGPDERPVIAQVGERILSRQESAEYARGGGRGVTININGVRNPDEFRQSQSQIASGIARAIGRSGRNR